ncbi:DUF4142 domain-containing protein [Burkholderiaceae bacterium UC74_6]
MRTAHRILALALMSAAFVAVAPAAQARTDASFMKAAAHAGAAEIEASRLAQTKAKNAEVKAFADKMVTAHAQVADELKVLATSKSVKLPDGPSMGQKAEIKLIDAGDNDKFDERYAQHFGVKAHEDAIKLFEEAAKSAKDADVKAWAAKTLPGLKEHLTMTQALPVLKK